MNLAAWLIAMVGPLVARVIASMGLTMVSMVGVTVAFETLKTKIQTSIGGLPAHGVGLGGLFGVWEALGIILGAMLFVITWRSTAGFWKFAKK